MSGFISPLLESLCRRSDSGTPAVTPAFRPRNEAQSPSIPDACASPAGGPGDAWERSSSRAPPSACEGWGGRGPFSIVAGAQRRLLDLHQELDVVARLLQLVQEQFQRLLRLERG